MLFFVVFLMGAVTVSVFARGVVVWSVVDAAVQKPYTAEFAEHAEPNGLFSACSAPSAVKSSWTVSGSASG
jgi:hypothetical protein